MVLSTWESKGGTPLSLIPDKPFIPHAPPTPTLRRLGPPLVSALSDPRLLGMLTRVVCLLFLRQTLPRRSAASLSCLLPRPQPCRQPPRLHLLLATAFLTGLLQRSFACLHPTRCILDPMNCRRLALCRLHRMMRLSTASMTSVRQVLPSICHGRRPLLRHQRRA